MRVPRPIGGPIRGSLRAMTERGLGILLSDHNVHVAFRYLDYAYLLADGRVQTKGTPAAVAADPEVRRLYLGDSFPEEQ